MNRKPTLWHVTIALLFAMLFTMITFILFTSLIIAIGTGILSFLVTIGASTYE